MIKEVRNNFALVNISFQESDGKEKNFYESYNEKFKALTNTKNVKKVATGNLSKMNVKKLNDILALQNQFLTSPLSSEKGRKEIEEKRYKAFKKSMNVSMSKEKYLKFIDLMNNDRVNQLIENSKLSSEQVIDLVKDFNGKKVENVLKDISNNDDYNKIDSTEFIERVYEVVNLTERQFNNYENLQKNRYVKEMLDDGLISNTELARVIKQARNMNVEKLVDNIIIDNKDISSQDLLSEIYDKLE